MARIKKYNIWLELFTCACIKASTASNGLFLNANQRGDSGMTKKEKNNIINSNGIADSNTPLQLPSEKTAPAPYPNTIPRTIAASFKETSLPLKSLGAVSAMYRGATCIAVPIPNPNITRPGK